LRRYCNNRLIFFSIILVIFFASSCTRNKKLKEGVIEYSISYPCLEKSENSLMFFLPKKMVMTFKNNCFKNKFIFSNQNSKLEAISNCNEKKLTLAFGYGKNMKYTNVDSNNVEILLNDLPKYSKINNELDSVKVLNKSALKFEISSTNNDSIFNIVTTQDIDIKNINWCTPFNEIDDVMLEYNLIQYGIEMKFKAINISETKVSDDFLKIDEDYEFSAVNKYLKEVKSILSIFSCK